MPFALSEFSGRGKVGFEHSPCGLSGGSRTACSLLDTDGGLGGRWKPGGVSFPGFLSGSDGKESTCNAGDAGSIPGLGRSPGGGHGCPLQYSCWKIPWTEDPGGLQSMGSQRIGHDSSVQVYQQEAGHGCHRCRSGLQLDQVV